MIKKKKINLALLLSEKVRGNLVQSIAHFTRLESFAVDTNTINCTDKQQDE